MPIEFRNPAAPAEIAATYGETSACALDDQVEREEIFVPVLSAIAHDMMDVAASVANDHPVPCHRAPGRLPGQRVRAH